MSNTRKVLLIGWDAADWKVISPLMDEGKMPALSKLVNEGVMGNLATLHPVLSPMLWTSISTGKRPFNHGVHGFTEPTPDGARVQPVTILSRTTKAIWNILCQSGYQCNVVGWWPSHPVEPINGCTVSDHYHRASGPPDQPWPMAAGTVQPDRVVETLKELRFNPGELTQEHVLPFIPLAGEIDQDRDRRLASFMKILGECTSIQSAATYLAEHEPWDFMAVYFDAIDHFCHGFMRYHPPRRPFIQEKEFEIYKGVVEGGYRYHDMMLHHLLKHADEDTTIILMSDHGFHPDHLRPKQLPREPAGPAVEHRDLGIFVIKGPGIKQDELVHGAGLLDIVPTILTLFGLPVGDDMNGKPLVNVFEETPEISTIPSWDEVEGDSGEHPPDRQLDPVEAREALKQLEELGYIEKLGENNEQAVVNTMKELDYNLARAYIDADLHEQARPKLEKLYLDNPSEYRFGIQLAMCYRALDRIKELRSLVEAMNKRRHADAESAREELQQISEIARDRREKLKEREEAEKKERKEKGLPEEDPDAPPKEAGLRRIFNQAEISRIEFLRSMAAINTYALDYLMGYVYSAEGNPEESLKLLEKARDEEPERPGLHIQIGEVLLKMKRHAEAEKSFQKALSIDPENPHAHLGLCKSYLPRKRNHEAAGEALATVGLLYQYPMAHFYLGIALHRLGRIRRAVDALKIAITQNPNFAEAHARLAYIYRHRLKNEDKAEEHQATAKEIRKQRRKQRGSKIDVPLPPEEIKPREQIPKEQQQAPQVPAAPTEEQVKALEELQKQYNGKPITVVSGLPRSGTSMIMQMLEAGGHPMKTDGIRASDDDNPKGYYEFEPVKNLRRDSVWMVHSGGTAVKVIAQLLPYLRPGLKYRIIFLERDLNEIMGSQRRMLERSGKQGGQLEDERLMKAFGNQVSTIKQLIESSEIPVLCLDHRDVISEPRTAADRIAEFFEEPLDAAKMAEAVDPTLYRCKR